MIFDTNALSAYADGDPNLLKLIRTAKRHQLPTIVLGEYRFGLLRSRERLARESWLVRLELECDVLDVNRQTAICYAEIREELRSLGRPIPENDIWIAAIAREHQLSILSRDQHFDQVPGLARFGW